MKKNNASRSPKKTMRIRTNLKAGIFSPGGFGYVLKMNLRVPG